MNATKKSAANKVWTVQWQTPIGPMTGRMAMDGWLNLEFPPARRQTLENDPRDREVRVVSCSPAALPGAPLPAEANRNLNRMTAFLTEYFAGRASATHPAIADDGRTPFVRRVREAAIDIPFGRTATYGDLAGRAGSARAARAVGQVMARNPLVLLIPCHRVLAGGSAGKGLLGGFTGGLALKRWLLRHEGTAVPVGPNRSPRPRRTVRAENRKAV
jgi:methylated-DNA-[protein]-cysteine S-methyltransferase